MLSVILSDFFLAALTAAEMTASLISAATYSFDVDQSLKRSLRIQRELAGKMSSPYHLPRSAIGQVEIHVQQAALYRHVITVREVGGKNYQAIETIERHKQFCPHRIDGALSCLIRLRETAGQQCLGLIDEQDRILVRG